MPTTDARGQPPHPEDAERTERILGHAEPTETKPGEAAKDDKATTPHNKTKDKKTSPSGSDKKRKTAAVDDGEAAADDDDKRETRSSAEKKARVTTEA